MSYCFCDYDPAEFYWSRVHRARKQHKCHECGKHIERYERYERVTAKWEGMIETCLTCERCLAVRGYVQAHVPCFCWAHHNMLDDAIECMREFSHELAPGMGMEFGRLYVKAARRNVRR
jgi:hypothetical protein